MVWADKTLVGQQESSGPRITMETKGVCSPYLQVVGITSRLLRQTADSALLLSPHHVHVGG